MCKIPVTNYAIVGDDLFLIKGDRIFYERYIKIMDQIGVEVNINKTILSENKSATIE